MRQNDLLLPFLYIFEPIKFNLRILIIIVKMLYHFPYTYTISPYGTGFHLGNVVFLHPATKDGCFVSMRETVTA